MKSQPFQFATDLKHGSKAKDIKLVMITGEYHPEQYNHTDGHTYYVTKVEMADNKAPHVWTDCTHLYEVLEFNQDKIADTLHNAISGHLTYLMQSDEQHEADIRNDERYEIFGQDTDLNPDNN